MKVSVFGLGYVGLANALLLAQKEEVLAYDIVDEKIDQLQKNISPLEDKEIHQFLERTDLSVRFTKAFDEAVDFGMY